MNKKDVRDADHIAFNDMERTLCTDRDSIAYSAVEHLFGKFNTLAYFNIGTGLSYGLWRVVPSGSYPGYLAIANTNLRTLKTIGLVKNQKKKWIYPRSVT